tara:strand:+ start:1279 stop:1464 length:186 start_codon:yes stop_codon:yes gene_type:complete
MKIGARSAQDRRKIGAKRQAQQSETTRFSEKIGEDRQRSAEIGAKAQQSETTRFVRQCERK